MTWLTALKLGTIILYLKLKAWLFFEPTDEPRWLMFASEGNKVAECQNFQFNYGGRRGFCKVEYADLGNQQIPSLANGELCKIQCRHCRS